MLNTTRKNHLEKGFTLIEMIGVLAIIATLAAVVAPKIFDAINDSKVTSLAENISTIRTTVTSYYKDTGVFPTQYSNSTVANQNQLMTKPANVKGWKGPYLDKALVNPVNGTGYMNTGEGRWTFDINGDGINDYGNGTAHITVSMVWFNGLTADQAKSLSNMIDSDGDNISGKNAWYKSGRVRTNNSADPRTSSNVTVYVFLGSR